MNDTATEEAFDADTEVVAYERSPLDVFRLLVFGAAALLVVLLTKYLRRGMDGLEENISALLSVDVDAVRLTFDSLLITAMVVTALATMLVPLFTRRWRLFGYVFTANLAASLSVSAVNAWVGDLDTGTGGAIGTNGVALDMSTDVAASTQVVAAFVALSPFVSLRWRRAGAWLVAAMVVLRIAVATGESTHSLLVLSLGSAIGSAVLLAFGRPTTQPRVPTIAAALHNSGLAVREIEPASVDARGSVPWFATLEGGERLFVKVLGTNQRAADLLFRVYRMLRLRNVGDERPFSSLRRTVEHEALVALNARDVGVRTPRMRAMSAVGGDGFLLAYDMIDGASLDSVEPEELTDDVLAAIWDQVSVLQRHRIAHRDLRLANLFLDRGAQPPEPWIIDFGFSEIAADDPLLNADVAQLLASLALVVGPRRAVAPALAALGPERLAACLTRLQPAALSGSTQSALKEREHLLADLREEIESAAGVGAVQLEPVTRFSGRQVFTLALVVGAVYFVAPRLADLPGVFGELEGADWSRLVPALVATAAGFVAAGFAMIGSVPSPLPAAPTFAAQVASAYASKFAPAGLGGMALNLRYLQKQGIGSAPANSAVGLNAVAGVVGHAALVIVFVLWAVRDLDSTQVTTPGALVAGLGLIAAMALLAMAVPHTRKLVLDRLLPLLSDAAEGLPDLLTSPSKLFLLLGGSTTGTFAQAVAFFFAARAFHVDEGFAVLVAVYLIGSAVASLAPTPGGVGAVEVALIAGLVAIGVTGAAAVPTVFLYRIVTYWIPVVPGWGCFGWLRRTDRL